MEVGKLVTPETCGNIFYFVVDEAHPDEPHEDASRYYYVVAPAVSTFSYRESYCVLCRALCGLDNRTYLHRWHSLYEQIFGTTPYVQFVNAVRDSPLVLRPNASHQTGGGHASHGATPSKNRAASSPALTHEANGRVVLPALFLDEETARLVLRKAEKEQRATAATDRHARHDAAGHSNRTQQGSSTPVGTPQAMRRVTAAPLVEGPLQDRQRQTERVEEVEEAAPRGASHPALPPDPSLEALRNLAAYWQQASGAVRDGGEQQRLVAQMQQDLQEERRRRLEAEELCARHARELEVARIAVVKDKSVVAPPQATRTDDEHAAQVSKSELRRLEKRIQELEGELLSTKRQHSEERDRLLNERDSMKQQLWQQSEAHGAQLKSFLSENAGAVRRVEEALEKREKDMCAVYTKALEERDVRIAQLSQEALQHLQTSRQLSSARSEQDRLQAERLTHLEEMNAQLKEWNATLRRQLTDATSEAQELRVRLDAAKAQQSTLIDSATSVQPFNGLTDQTRDGIGGGLHCSVCGGLPRGAAVKLAEHLQAVQEELDKRKADVAAKAGELERAAEVMELLTRGVRRAKMDVEAEWSRRVSLVVDSPHDTAAVAQRVT